MTHRVSSMLVLAGAAGCAQPDAIVQPESADRPSPAATAQVQAQPLAGTESIFGANSLGGLVGRLGAPGAFYSNAGGAPLALGAPGRAQDITEDGLTVVGFTGTCCDGAFVYQNVGGSWQYTVLPKASGATNGARGVASDPITGAVVYVAGFDFYRTNGTNFYQQPALWAPNGSGWVRYSLPAPSGTDSPLLDVNAGGGATGSIGGRAAVWTPDGSGGWTSTVIGGTSSQGWAISADGNTVVGFAGSAAQYWTLSGGVWTAHTLPGGCTEAVDIDDGGRILANGCANGKAKSPAVIASPYGSANIQLLGGIGTSGTVATAHRMAANGSWIAGEATSKGSTVGVYWRLP